MYILTLIQNRLHRKPTNGSYIAEMDGLRFIAILAVVLQHLSERMVRFAPLPFDTPITDNPLAFFISRGTVGVFLFFAISGFVLSLPFATSTPLSIKHFYVRRLERIEPPYIIWMTFFALILLAKGTYSISDICPHWLASVTYTHWFFFGEYSTINPVAWSLEIEIQFYLLAPFLAQAYFSFKNTTKRRVGLITFSILIILLQGQLGWLHFPMKATIFGRLPNFLIGFLVADFYINDWKNELKKQGIWDVIAVLSFVTLCYTWTEETLKTLIFNVSLGLLCISAFKGRLFSRFLSTPWIAIIGGMCYTIYLTHLPLLEGLMRLTHPLSISTSYGINLGLQALIILPILLLSSILFFLLIEKPFMRKNWHKDIKTTFSFPFKTLKRLVMPALLWAICTLTVQAQDIDTLKILKLRPLGELTELALQNAPALKANDVDFLKQTLLWKVQKRSWGDMISLSGSTLYGNGSVMDANNNGTATNFILTDRKSFNFNIGLSMRISGGDILARSTKAEIQRLQLDRIQQERQINEQNIREAIAILYTQLEASIKILRLKAEAVENQRLALAVAEKFFKEGNYQPTEYSNMLGKVTSAEEQYEQAKAEAKKYTLVLKNLIGSPVF
jgi:peptidoglycan/LPS O-acetylase OafA/YrhL